MINPATHELIAFLNGLAKIDPVAMGKLIGTRVKCNAELAKHPTVQVGYYDVYGKEILDADCHAGDNGVYRVGILGILNGFCGTFDSGPYKGWGPITAEVQVDGRVTEFRITGLV